MLRHPKRQMNRLITECFLYVERLWRLISNPHDTGVRGFPIFAYIYVCVSAPEQTKNDRNLKFAKQNRQDYTVSKRDAGVQKLRKTVVSRGSRISP